MKHRLILIVLLCSMIPIIELRGAIPLGAGISEIEWVSDIFNIQPGETLPWWLNYIVSVIGNMIPIPFILVFIKSILNFMKRGPKFLSKIAIWLESKADKHSDRVKASQTIGLILFVGIPLPGTGAWTGALIAALMGIRLKTSLPSIFAGVVIAGAIMTLASYGLVGFLNIFI
ncbi:MAG: small multi-drug export protein [Clostridia bacterium]|nr:small multi-drug export protein [Clostridia bacterium]